MDRPGLKKQRQSQLLSRLEKDPFLTDEELAEIFKVSVPTIRLDRVALNIAEYRERVKRMAEENYKKVRSLGQGEILGEIVYIKPGEEAISILKTDNGMLFQKSGIVRGHFIYEMAESVAIAVIDADAALIGIANIKYKRPVFSGTKLTARAIVREVRDDQHIVWVKITAAQTEVFSGKFILKAI